MLAYHGCATHARKAYQGYPSSPQLLRLFKKANMKTNIKGAIEEEIPNLVTQIESQVSKKMKLDVEKEVKTQVEKIMQDSVSKEIENKIQVAGHSKSAPGANTSPGKIVEMSMKEMVEREERKNNLLIFRLKEPEGNLKDEKRNEDKETFIDICSKIGVPLSPSKIKEVRRLGNKKQDGKPRAVLVKLTDYSKKGNIFKNTVKLAGTVYKEISLQNDLTQKQRDNEAKLWDEARRRNQLLPSETKVWRVVGPPWARELQEREKKKPVKKSDNQEQLKNRGQGAQQEEGQKMD